MTYRSRRAPFPWATVGMIAAAALLGGFVLGLVANAFSGAPSPSLIAGGSVGPSASASVAASTEASLDLTSGTPEPSGSASPTPAPSVAPLAANSIAQVAASGLRLRSEASTSSSTLRQLKLGAKVFVVSGPTIDAGLAWYEIAAVDLQPPSYGWAAGVGTNGEVYLKPSQTTCPGTPGTLKDLRAHSLLLWISCQNSGQFSLLAYVPDPSGVGIGCTPWKDFSPDWLAPCRFIPVADATELAILDFVYVDPALGQPCSDGPSCAFNGLQGGWAQMTVHLDDSAAKTCEGPPPVPSQWKGVSAGEIVLQCRERLVVTHVQAAPAP